MVSRFFCYSFPSLRKGIYRIFQQFHSMYSMLYTVNLGLYNQHKKSIIGLLGCQHTGISRYTQTFYTQLQAIQYSRCPQRTSVQGGSSRQQHSPKGKGVRNRLSSANIIYRPLVDTRTSIIFLLEVFPLAFPHNSKLNPAHTTKQSTTTNCNSTKLSSKSYARFSKYTQIKVLIKQPHRYLML